MHNFERKIDGFLRNTINFDWTKSEGVHEKGRIDNLWLIILLCKHVNISNTYHVSTALHTGHLQTFQYYDVVDITLMSQSTTPLAAKPTGNPPIDPSCRR